MILTCKLCGHQDPTGDLVPHVESEHSGEQGLTTYIARFGGIDAVIHPERQRAAATAPAPVLATPTAPTASPARSPIGTLLDATATASELRLDLAATAPTRSPVEIAAHDQKQAVEVEPETVEMVTIAGVEIAKRGRLPASLQAFVPKIDDAYHFGEKAARVVKSILKGKAIALVGHTGTGKTSLIMQIAARINQPVIRVNLNQQTTIADFVGTWGVKGGETLWIDGALPWSMRHNVWVVADEADYAEPAILSVLNAVTESNPKLMLSQKDGEVVPAGDHWRIFVTGNTLGQYSEWRHLYQGTNLMNEAWLDRFRVFMIDYLPEDAEAEVLSRAVPLMTLNVAKQLVKVAVLARQAFLKEELQCTFSTRRLIDWAEEVIENRAARQEAPFKAAETTIFSKVSREDHAALEGFMRRILLGNDSAGRR